MGRALMMEISVLIKKDPESLLIPSTMCGYNKKLVVCNPEKDSCQNPAMLALDFQLPQLLAIVVLLFEAPNLWYFVIEA